MQEPKANKQTNKQTHTHTHTCAYIYIYIYIYIYMALFSERHIKPHERFSVPSYYLYCLDNFPGGKGGTAVAVKKVTCVTL
jgi:hypothetical protein